MYSFVLYDLFSDYVLDTGSGIELSSPNYPYYYPSNTHILWTFESESNADRVTFQISFGILYLGFSDTLTVGTGFDPTNSTLFNFTHGYHGNLSDIIIESSVIYIELQSHESEGEGQFQLNVMVRNSAGNIIPNFEHTMIANQSEGKGKKDHVTVYMEHKSFQPNLQIFSTCIKTVPSSAKVSHF